MEMKYEFNIDDAFRFARSVNAYAKQHGNELMFTYCPYCHGGDHRDKNTFSINLQTGQFKCMRSGCGRKGNLLTLEKEFDGFSLGRTYDEFYKPKKMYKELVQPKQKIIPVPYAVQYLQNRGISEETARAFQISTVEGMPTVLYIPFFDEHGVMQFVKYRNTVKPSDPDAKFNKEWCEKDCKPILFGMNMCDTNNKTLIITEGQIDTLSVYEAGYHNCVSVPTGVNGFTWIPYCWNWLSNFDTLIVFGDFEKGHITLLEDMRKHFVGTVKNVRIGDYKDCKDANDILRKYGKEQIRVCIENAETPPVDRLNRFGDIKSVPPNSVPKLETPFDHLNTFLHGGIPYGGYSIITSKRGNGKSILADHIIAHAIAQGKNTLIYSGEIPNGTVKALLISQIVGRENMVDVSKPGSDYKDYAFASSVEKKVSDWVGEHCYIYDDKPCAEDEQEDIFNTIELAVKRNNVEVVLLDNLMVAIDIAGDVSKINEETVAQARFCKRLYRLSKDLNIVVILVAHKRKATEVGGDADENDDVSGSSLITNLSMVTLGYNPVPGAATDKEKSQRVLSVAKNRLYGELTTNGGIRMDYEPISRRIYQEGVDDPDRRYNWNGEEYGQEETKVINAGFLMTGTEF